MTSDHATLSEPGKISVCLQENHICIHFRADFDRPNGVTYWRKVKAFGGLNFWVIGRLNIVKSRSLISVVWIFAWPPVMENVFNKVEKKYIVPYSRSITRTFITFNYFLFFLLLQIQILISSSNFDFKTFSLWFILYDFWLLEWVFDFKKCNFWFLKWNFDFENFSLRFILCDFWFLKCLFDF